MSVRLGRGFRHLGWLAAVVGLIFVARQQVHNLLHAGLNGVDFDPNMWSPARAILHGATVYRSTVYPPPLFLASLPFGLLPKDVATALMQVLLVGLAALVLAILGVRDWRCYAIWLLSGPFVFDLIFANPTLLAVLAAAALWRWRDRPLAAAAALSAGIALKYLLLPVGVWMLVTGRVRAAAYTAVAAPLVLVASWAVIGFQGLSGYPHLLAVDRHAFLDQGLLVSGLATKAGAGATVSVLSGLVSGLACLALAVRMRRDEVASFTLAVYSTCLIAPICWTYYLGLMVVPLAIRRPRLSREWLIFAWFWLANLLVIPLSLWLVWRLARKQDPERDVGIGAAQPATP